MALSRRVASTWAWRRGEPELEEPSRAFGPLALWMGLWRLESGEVESTDDGAGASCAAVCCPCAASVCLQKVQNLQAVLQKSSEPTAGETQHFEQQSRVAVFAPSFQVLPCAAKRTKRCLLTLANTRATKSAALGRTLSIASAAKASSLSDRFGSRQRPLNPTQMGVLKAYLAPECVAQQHDFAAASG